ncbi:hypothetical protein DL95DRAFT_471010 [Leptodontidium sp. 2 PMI_412]|nr:hypothetical protein DL95DRAFT_471010 [Leptodontidium sp. 2 PMI_412]
METNQWFAHSPSDSAMLLRVSAGGRSSHLYLINTNTKTIETTSSSTSRAFLSSLSTLYTLPNEDFARLCASIHRASTSCDPDTPPTNDAGSPSADLSKEERTRNPGKGSWYRYKTSGNANDDLKWLATKIRQFPTINFRALCGVFNIVMANLLQHYGL